MGETVMGSSAFAQQMKLVDEGGGRFTTQLDARPKKPPFTSEESLPRGFAAM
jgi:hypothetical protein